MFKVDVETNRVILESDEGTKEYGLDSPEAFRLISDAWLRCGWDTKYVYSFTWLGRPIIQLPEDMLRIQEVLFKVKPDVIVETGVAHGGSLIFYASLCKAMGRGRVIGIDIEIRDHNRKAIEEHDLYSFITLVQGSSVDPKVVDQVKSLIKHGDKVMVLLDSCHSKEHVLSELEAYSPLTSQGSYIVAMDGIMQQVVGAPRTKPDWAWNNPKQAAAEFVKLHPNFVIEEPEFLFNEGKVKERITYCPSGFIRRIS